jgi:hypothetical protein
VPNGYSALCCKNAPTCEKSPTCGATEGIQLDPKGGISTKLKCCKPTSKPPSHTRTLELAQSTDTSKQIRSAVCADDQFPHLTSYALSRSSPTAPFTLHTTCSKDESH